MPVFYALVDAQPGREEDVTKGLEALEGVRFVRVKERAHDFLLRVDVPDFDVVDDFLQTYVRPIRGVMGVEVITDWDDVGLAARDARGKLA